MESDTDWDINNVGNPKRKNILLKLLFINFRFIPETNYVNNIFSRSSDLVLLIITFPFN